MIKKVSRRTDAEIIKEILDFIEENWKEGKMNPDMSSTCSLEIDSHALIPYSKITISTFTQREYEEDDSVVVSVKIEVANMSEGICTRWDTIYMDTLLNPDQESTLINMMSKKKEYDIEQANETTYKYYMNVLRRHLK